MDGIRTQLFRLLVFIFAVMIAVSLLLSVIFYSITARSLKEQMGNKCLGIAVSVATLLEHDTDGLHEYLGTLDTRSDYYLHTKRNLEKIRSGNADNIAFLYVERRISDEEMCYVLDGELPTSDGFSPPGEIDRMTSTRLLCYETGAPVVGDFLLTAYGHLLSAYAPVIDRETGEVLAIVGTDVSIEQYDAIMNNQRLAILLNTVIFALLAVVLMFITSSLAERRLFRDALTGVYNRSFFTSFLRAQMKAIRRQNYPVLVFMADIDHFKRVNDTYGHPFGDKVLANVSGVMNSFMRKSDCLARYGGEEFAAILPGLNIENARGVIRRIHNGVRDAVTIDPAESLEVQVTISIGVAQLNSYESIDSAIKQADLALYEAKKTRDAVVFYNDLGK